MSASDRIVWIDCEMTGLDPDVDELVEVAVIVTDFDLAVLDPGLQVVIRPSDTALRQMSDFVRDMHEKSGLAAEIAQGVTVSEAEREVLEYVRRFVPLERTAPLGGNTIGTDRMFLAHHMRELDSYLHYRSIDVSSIKELARRWVPRAYFQAPEKAGDHRALTDILESVLELRYYREALFAGAVDRTSEDFAALATALRADFATQLAN